MKSTTFRMYLHLDLEPAWGAPTEVEVDYEYDYKVNPMWTSIEVYIPCRHDRKCKEIHHRLCIDNLLTEAHWEIVERAIDNDVEKRRDDA